MNTLLQATKVHDSLIFVLSNLHHTLKLLQQAGSPELQVSSNFEGVNGVPAWFCSSV
jgi:hypothetical protein